ncbi:hypothetical protein SUGI_0481460 [Cryptomeria japonica]|nr:hypothetical protein SUGI_0481460 [Cryptomeria japonica]
MLGLLRMDDARQVFENMPIRDFCSWTTVLSGVCARGVCEVALTLWNEEIYLHDNNSHIGVICKESIRIGMLTFHLASYGKLLISWWVHLGLTIELLHPTTYLLLETGQIQVQDSKDFGWLDICKFPHLSFTISLVCTQQPPKENEENGTALIGWEPLEDATPGDVWRKHDDWTFLLHVALLWLLGYVFLDLTSLYRSLY